MILEVGRNVWKTVSASRAAVLIDGADYYLALRQAFIKAERSIRILGWDIDSRTKLVGPTGKANDGLPEELGKFLSALCKRRPELRIDLLLWDYSLVYAMEREPLPLVAFQWQTAPGVRLAMDGNVPMGASQHQKIVAVDDSVAFTGGLDITIRRWDTTQHAPHNAFRVDPAGKPYRPFHDVQAIVDGDAARALSEIVRTRWRAATDEDVAVRPGGTDVWPASVVPDFVNVAVGVARTEPLFDDALPVRREVAELFSDMISSAENFIYLENQFITAPEIAAAIASRMREQASLEVLCVLPKAHDSWMAETATRNGRIRFMEVFAEPDLRHRIRFVYPCAASDAGMHTMVHSKVMIVDDRLLRVGSANLNRRSMGTDTECDIVIEASTQREVEAIAAVRHRLLGDLCATSASTVAEYCARERSILKLSHELPGNGRILCDIKDEPLDIATADVIEQLGDPSRPLSSWGLMSIIRAKPGPRTLWPVAALISAICIVGGMSLLWQLGAVELLFNPDRVARVFESSVSSTWAGIVVVGVFVLGGLIAFPVNVLIAATAATFGAVEGSGYAFAGIFASSLVTYMLGAWLGRDALNKLVGPRITRLRKRIVAKGVLAVAAIRLVPIAPFSLVNLVAGASTIPVFDFVLGTMLGMLPGVVLLSTLGEHVVAVITRPSWQHLGIVVAVLILWIGFVLAVQFLLQRKRGAAVDQA